jgi:Phosphotransferase enzyme family
MTARRSQPAEVLAVDAALPDLAGALDPEAAARAFESTKRYAGSRVLVQRASLVRHKPGRRAVIDYDFVATWPDGRRETVEAVGKMRAARPPRTAYNLLRQLWKNGFDAASADGISVPEPLAKLPALGLWLQRRVRGVVATSLVTTPAGVPLARRIADAADKLHHAGVAPQRAHGPDDELAVLARLFADVGCRNIRLRRPLAALLERCRQAAARVSGPTTGIHRDFYADQVIVDGTRVFMLDFDLYCEGHPALDLGNFAGHLVEQGLREPTHASALTAAYQALEARYVTLAGADAGPQLRIYTALTLARHVALSTVFPDRAHTTLPLLDAAMSRLEAIVDDAV